MDPYTIAVLGTVQAVATAVTEVCKVLQTPEGQKSLERGDKFWTDAGNGIKSLFDGTLFKIGTK